MKKLVLVLLIACTAVPGSGYITRKRLKDGAILQDKWASFPVTWILVATPGSNITGNRTLSQVANNSFGAWDAISTATIAFTRGADGGASAPIAVDGVNVLRANLTTGQWATLAMGAVDALAITLTPVGNPTGDIGDADIIFNPDPTYLFSLDATTPSTHFDFESVLTHEVGHFLGLDHSAILAATMFPRLSEGVSLKRALSSDDHAGVSSLYPTASFLTRGSISGTVRTTSNAAVYGAIVVAVDSNGQPVAHGVSDPSGNYTIYGLGSGAYTIYAEPMDSPFNATDQGVLGAIFPGSTVSTNFTTRFR